MALGLSVLMKARRRRRLGSLRIQKRLTDGRQLLVREGTAADSHQVYTMLEKLVLFQKLPEDLNVSRSWPFMEYMFASLG